MHLSRQQNSAPDCMASLRSAGTAGSLNGTPPQTRRCVHQPPQMLPRVLRPSGAAVRLWRQAAPRPGIPLARPGAGHVLARAAAGPPELSPEHVTGDGDRFISEGSGRAETRLLKVQQALKNGTLGMGFSAGGLYVLWAQRS